MRMDDEGRCRLHSQLTLFDDQVGRRFTFCAHCRRRYRPGEEPDPCIGRELPGVAGCCCGHGDASEAYVDLASAWAAASAASDRGSDHERWWAVLSRHRLTGEAALAFFATHGCGPSR